MNGQTPIWNNNKNKESSRSKLKSNTNNNGEKKKNCRRPTPRPHETEEEAILRRFHDAQRMARFRAKRKKAVEEAKALEAAKLTEMAISELRRRNVVFEITTSKGKTISSHAESSSFKQNTQDNSLIIVPTVVGQCKYSQLLSLIEELGRDIRLTYAGSKTSSERLKIGIMQARRLIKDCILETEINSQK